MNRPRGEDAAGDVELGDLRARASATVQEPVPQVSAALELWDSQDIEMMDLGKQQSKREACSNASFSALSACGRFTLRRHTTARVSVSCKIHARACARIIMSIH